jgi:hypothetical protein
MKISRSSLPVLLENFFGANGIHWEFEFYSQEFVLSFLARVANHIEKHPQGLIARHAQDWK